MGSSKRVAVIGGNGFLGSELTRQLVRAGHKVTVLCRSAPDELPTGASHKAVSVLDKAALADALSDAEVVYHLAGLVVHSRSQHKEVQAMRRLHVDGTRNVMETVRAGTLVIYASTSGVVGCAASGDVVAREDSAYINTDWPYYATKIEAEKVARALAAERNVPLICMRPSLVVGPGDWRLSSSRSILDFINGKIPFCPAGGLSFVDVRCAAAAFASAIERGVPGRTYLLGSANMSFSEYFALLSQVSGVRAPFLSGIDGLVLIGARGLTWLLGLFGKHDPSMDPVVVEMSRKFWYIDCAAAKKDLGFAPREPKETLRDAVLWLRENQAKL